MTTEKKITIEEFSQIFEEKIEDSEASADTAGDYKNWEAALRYEIKKDCYKEIKDELAKILGEKHFFS